jgi:hypothetical protein
MSKWLGVSFWTMKNHYKYLRQGKHTCQGYSSCVLPVVEDINRCACHLRDDADGGEGS